MCQKFTGTMSPNYCICIQEANLAEGNSYTCKNLSGIYRMWHKYRINEAAYVAFLLNTIYISISGTTKHNGNNVLYLSGRTSFPYGVHESL